LPYRTSRNRNPIDFEKFLQQTVCSSKWLVFNPIPVAGFARSLTNRLKEMQQAKETTADKKIA